MAVQSILLYSSVDDCYRIVTGFVSNIHASLIRDVFDSKCVCFRMIASGSPVHWHDVCNVLTRHRAYTTPIDIAGRHSVTDMHRGTFVCRRTNQYPVCSPIPSAKPADRPAQTTEVPDVQAAS